MSKRAVLYARVSGDDTASESRNLAGQLAMCREYAEKQGWEVVAELHEDDRGASGVSLDLPQLNRVLEMARLGAFDVLVVRELDRLSRSLAKQLLVEEELRRAGVQISYVLGEYPDTLEGTLGKHIRAAIAEYERLKIRERTVRAKRLKVQSGKVLLHGNRAPYGYRASEDGNALVIYEPEARIVRLIYDWYVNGDEDGRQLGGRAIAARLTEMGASTYYDRHGCAQRSHVPGHWSSGTVHHILACETYAGRWYYGRRNIGGNPRRPTDNPRSHWIEVGVPAIIDEDLWKEAAQRKQSNEDRAARNVKYDYLMRKRMVCGACGGKIRSRTLREGKHRAKTFGYYVCIHYDGQAGPERCGSPQFSAAAVDKAVWTWLKTLLMDSTALKEGLLKHQTEVEAANRPLQQRLEILKDLIASNRSQMERLLDLYLVGDIPRDLLSERRKRLEHTISTLEREERALRAQFESKVLTAEQIEGMVQFAAVVSDGLEQADLDFAIRDQIVTKLGVEATLAVEDGEKVVHARCILGEKRLQFVSATSIDTARCTPAPPRRPRAPAPAIPRSASPAWRARPACRPTAPA